jgi:hypothetical protein
MSENGQRLERMAANDMLDVLHYYFELDVLGDEDFMKAKAEMRKQLYGMLYERAYRWGESSTSSNHEFGTQEVGADPISGAPELTHKPYVPPTPVNPTAARPYGTLVDPPLG